MRRILIFAAAFAIGLAWLADRRRHAPAPPFAARYLTVGGTTLRAAVGGAGEPTIVLLHGYAESALSWAPVTSGLAADFRVAALDLLGHGLSAKPATGYRIEAMGELTAQAIAALSDSAVVLVGHSMGGAIAAWVAARRPALVRRLVLVDAAGVPGPILSSVRRLSSGAVAALFGAGAAVRTPHDPTWLREDPEASSYQPSADPAYYVALEAILREFDFAGLDSILPDVRQPTLLIWGAHDRLTPMENAQRFDSLIPRSTLVIVGEALHRPHTTHPSEVRDLIAGFARGRTEQQ